MSANPHIGAALETVLETLATRSLTKSDLITALEGVAETLEEALEVEKTQKAEEEK